MAGVAFRYAHLSNWTPAFAGVVLLRAVRESGIGQTKAHPFATTPPTETSPQNNS